MARRNGRSVTESIVKQSGSPRFLGTIVATAATSNVTTSSPFASTGTHLLSKILLIQSDSNCYLLATQQGQEASVSATNGVQIFAGERVELCMDDQDTDVVNATESLWNLTIFPVTGTSNVKVWELQ
jgi:hypothetical protein